MQNIARKLILFPCCCFQQKRWFMGLMFTALAFILLETVFSIGLTDQMSSLLGFQRIIPEPFLERMSRRRALVSAVCSGELFPEGNPDVKKLFVVPEKKLIWCPVYKAGSTGWFGHLIKLAKNKKNIKQRYRHLPPRELARKLFPPLHNLPSILDLTVKHNFNSFMYVRHPFHRLVSAYRDKFEFSNQADPKGTWFHEKHGATMMSMFREKSLAKFGPEFFSPRNHYGTPLKQPAGKIRSNLMPTFWEFIQYVRHVEKSVSLVHDVHWRPIAHLCSPCSVPYNYILRLEDATTEEKKLFKALGIDKEVQPKDAHTRSPSNYSQDQLVEIYFAQLDNDDLHDLKQIYSIDFKMFGYQYQNDAKNKQS